MEIEDINEISVLLYADGGELEPLAEHIESGGGLGPTLREWLATYLRSKNLPQKQGRKRRWSQVETEMKVVRAVRAIQYDGKLYLALSKLPEKDIKQRLSTHEKRKNFIFENHGKISESAAIKLYVDIVEDAEPIDTVKTYMKKAKKLYPPRRACP